MILTYSRDNNYDETNEDHEDGALRVSTRDEVYEKVVVGGDDASGDEDEEAQSAGE